MIKFTAGELAMFPYYSKEGQLFKFNRCCFLSTVINYNGTFPANTWFTCANLPSGFTPNQVVYTSATSFTGASMNSAEVKIDTSGVVSYFSSIAANNLAFSVTFATN